MTAASRGIPKAFKRALVFSALLHAGLLIFIAASPSLPRSQPKGLIQYVNLVSFPGGGGPGGGGQAAPQAEPLPPPRTKETLRDLTLPEKVKADEKPGLRYPVDKPKTAKKVPEKKAAITKPQPTAGAAASGAETAAAAATGGKGQSGTGGPGYGLRFGTGPGGTGTGSGGGSE